MYSRTVYMETFLDDLIHPVGWLEWSKEFALKILYYGEYMNVGTYARLDGHVTWPGYKIIKTAQEANQFRYASTLTLNDIMNITTTTYVSTLLSTTYLLTFTPIFSKL